MARIGNDGGFQRALARFKNNLSPTQREDFAVTSLEDVQKTIVQIQSNQGSQRKMRNLTRIRGFVEAMEQYGQVVEVFLNVSDIIAFVWGPLKFLLQIASTWVESFDVLLDAYEEISENIPQLSEYGEIFGLHKHMRKSLEMIYGDILEFHRRALKFFRRPTWKQLFHSSWKTFKTQFQHILTSLSRHKNLIESQASLVEYEQSEIARVTAQNSFEEIAKAETRRRTLAVTEKIHPPNSRIDQDKAKETRQEYPESGKWILRDPLLRDWMDLSCLNVPLLWINGIPGAGKTVIASLIIEEMEAVNSVILGFFYCKYNDSQRNCFIKILSGVLAQLIQQNEELLSYMYDACCSSSETRIESENLLKRLVEISLRSCSANTCIVIDGIDECEEAEERKTIAFFLEISNSIAKDNAESIRLLFVSQRDKVTEKLLDNAAVVTLDSKYHREDIRAFALSWSIPMQRRFEIPEASSTQISINVADQARGLFLFAKLVLTHLYAQTTREKFSRELQPDCFPTGLEAAYERIALRIYEGPNCEDAHNIFRWIACARRPLKWNDIQSIFAIDIDFSSVNFDERRLRVSCRDLCGSLVENNAEDTLNFVHKSAKQYLVKSGRIAIRSEELQIAEFCISYLNFSCFDAELTESEIRAFLQEGYYSFEDYAIAYWLDHLESSTSHPLPSETLSLESLRQRIEDFFVQHGSNMVPDSSAANSQKFQNIRQWSFIQQLDTLAQLARERKSNEKYLDIETQLLRRRRIYEAIITDPNPNDVILESLRLNGSRCFKCPRIQCGYFSDGFQRKQDREQHVDQHERPFRCSHEGCFYAEFGFGSERELKRHEKTSHLTAQSSEWVFPTPKPRKESDIFSAARKGDLATIERLAGEGADLNRTTKPRGEISALFLAVKHNHPHVASYLIGQGCRAIPGILNMAIGGDRMALVQMLLETEADPMAKKDRAQTALYKAALFGSKDVISCLLTYPIDINQRRYGEGTPLQVAKFYRHDKAVQILLENGALDESPEQLRRESPPPTPSPATPVTPKTLASLNPDRHDVVQEQLMDVVYDESPFSAKKSSRDLRHDAYFGTSKYGDDAPKAQQQQHPPDIAFYSDILTNFEMEQFLQEQEQEQQQQQQLQSDELPPMNPATSSDTWDPA